MDRSRAQITFDELRVFQLDPNLTAILPGLCQARCPFCVEPHSRQQATADEWLQSFRTLLCQELPEVFRTLTVSGGEPTLSPAFEEVLRILIPLRSSGRLLRTVLTTNGTHEGLSSRLDLIGDAFTHVNISRHAVRDEVNRAVFKSDQVPSTQELAGLISKLNRRGIPVNLNCVYSLKHAFGKKIKADDGFSLRTAAKDFISFAKAVGASSVVFRLDHREPSFERATFLEEAFNDYKTVHEAQCKSCHVIGKFIRGLPVNFKRSSYEPIELHPAYELYEMVLHSDGCLWRDWSRKYMINRPLPNRIGSEDWYQLAPRGVSGITSPVTECDGPQQTCTLLLSQTEPPYLGVT